MDFSAANTSLWNVVIQFGIIAAAILLSTLLRRKLPFVRKTMLPTSVLAGFLLLICRSLGLLELDATFLETATYHGIAIGFIAMSLRVPAEREHTGGGGLIGAKSGALIVSTYLVQALVGLAISIGLAYTIQPELFKTAGILLPMGYGQGPARPTTSARAMRRSALWAGARSACRLPPPAICARASSASSISMCCAAAGGCMAAKR